MKLYQKKWVQKLGIFVGFILLLFCLRVPIMRGMGNYLVAEDPASPVEVIFVLSGGAAPRGSEAARLYHQNIAPKIVITGEEASFPLYNQRNKMVSMAEHTAWFVYGGGVDSSNVEILKKGKSTYTEFLAVKEYCLTHQLTRIMIISSDFHTRRVRQVFQKKLSQNGISALIKGAPSDSFDPDAWWTTENGLVMVNNEYLKILYYFFKY